MSDKVESLKMKIVRSLLLFILANEKLSEILKKVFYV